MSTPKIALLPDRGLVRVGGEDALKLLDAVVTNDLAALDLGGTVIFPHAVYAGLLSPQGKILHDMLMAAWGNEILIEVDKARVGDLVKRLQLYRLRAKVTIKDEGEAMVVVAGWGEDLPGLVHVVDRRHPELGRRWWMPADAMKSFPSAATSHAAYQAYHSHRIALGVPEGGKDWDFGDTFAHEANFDLLNGVSFTKGCYVGQEIVARMEHRGTVRKRVVRVSAGAELAADRPDVTVGDVVIGKLGSVAGNIGMALMRLDRAIEAIDAGRPITAAGTAIEIDPEMIARQRQLMAEKASTP